MAFLVSISGNVASAIQAEAEAHNVSSPAVVRGLITTIVEEGILEKMVAGVDLEHFEQRKPGHPGRYVYKGKRHTLRELSEISGLIPTTIRDRIIRGWSVEKAVETPAMKRGGRRDR